MIGGDNNALWEMKNIINAGRYKQCHTTTFKKSANRKPTLYHVKCEPINASVIYRMTRTSYNSVF